MTASAGPVRRLRGDEGTLPGVAVVVLAENRGCASWPECLGRSVRRADERAAERNFIAGIIRAGARRILSLLSSALRSIHARMCARRVPPDKYGVVHPAPESLDTTGSHGAHLLRSHGVSQCSPRAAAVGRAKGLPGIRPPGLNNHEQERQPKRIILPAEVTAAGGPCQPGARTGAEPRVSSGTQATTNRLSAGKRQLTPGRERPSKQRVTSTSLTDGLRQAWQDCSR